MDFKMSYLLNIIGGLIIKGSAQEKTLKFGNKLFLTQNLRSTLFPVYRSGHEKEEKLCMLQQNINHLLKTIWYIDSLDIFILCQQMTKVSFFSSYYDFCSLNNQNCPSWYFFGHLLDGIFQLSKLNLNFEKNLWGVLWLICVVN